MPVETETAPVEPVKPVELDPVLAWRFEQMKSLGLPEEDARRLAGDGQVDLHEVARVMRGGCSAEVALRIFAPLGGEAA